MWAAVRPPRWRFLDIPNKRQMKQPKDRMSCLTMQVKIIACSAIVDNSLFHPAASASWQGWGSIQVSKSSV